MKQRFICCIRKGHGNKLEVNAASKMLSNTRGCQNRRILYPVKPLACSYAHLVNADPDVTDARNDGKVKRNVVETRESTVF
jgi:hypothetical protein